MIPAAVAALAKRKAAQAAIRHGRRRTTGLAGGFVTLSVGAPLLTIVVAIGGIAPTGAGLGTFTGDIPPTAVAAYQTAAVRCPGLDWTVLAGIGRVESNHGRIFAGTITPTGDVTPPIVGIPLDGTNNTAAIPVPPGGSPWHGDPVWDRATGPMQFITGTWNTWGVDANGDGTATPHNIFDATATAADYLCGTTGQVTDLAAAIHRYNNSSSYVTDVLAWADQYQAQTEPGHGPPTAATGVLVAVPAAAGTTITVDETIAGALAQLLQAAAVDGIVLTGTGWRDPLTQIRLRVTNGCPDIYTAPPSTCRIPTAIPGTSLHEQGLAIDFAYDGTTICYPNTAATCQIQGDPAYRWLDTNAARYGLRGLASEAWHFSSSGR